MLQRKQELARKAIVDACATCKGHGCRHCSSAVMKINGWANSGIPVIYWDYTMETFNGDIALKNVIEKQVKEIELLYNNGSILVFGGKYGVGKTWAGTELLKTALVNKYTAQYTSMSDLVNTMLSKDIEKYSFHQKLLYSDFVFIDEVDARFIPSNENGMNMFGTMMENIIRTRLQNKLPIIMATNNSDINEVFDGTFGQVFNSLFSSKSVISIPVGGIDLRGNR
jgi:DNA replication protein DnaC